MEDEGEDEDQENEKDRDAEECRVEKEYQDSNTMRMIHG